MLEFFLLLFLPDYCIVTNDALSFSPEAGGADLVPPLIDVPLLVKLLALVVEAVRDLVSNHHTDPSKIQGFGEKLKISLQP